MSANAMHCFGIVTKDKEKAEAKARELMRERNDLKYYSNSPVTGLTIEFENGGRFVWISPSSNARCYRLHGMYIDRSISIEDYLKVYRIYCSGYCEWVHYF